MSEPYSAETAEYLKVARADMAQYDLQPQAYREFINATDEVDIHRLLPEATAKAVLESVKSGNDLDACLILQAHGLIKRVADNYVQSIKMVLPVRRRRAS